MFENYQEEGVKAMGEKKKITLGILSVAVVIVVGVLLLNKTVFAVKLVDSVTAEAGSKVPSITSFFEKEEPTATFLTDMNTINMDEPGIYDIKFSVDGREYSSKLEVIDTIPPKADVLSFEIWPEEVKKAGDFVTNIVDVTNVQLSFQEEPDYNKVGEQDVQILLEDTSGNKTVKVAKLIIKEDTESPVINGIQAYTIFAGESIDFEKGIVVTDNRDESVKLTVDTNAVNFDKAGQYEVVYNATDKSGNVVSVTTSVTVKEDTEAPIITGVKNQTVIVGGRISYKTGVQVTDNHDESVELKIDTSKVNLKEIGKYQVTYKATDKSGNITSKTATISVIEKPKVSEAELNKLADQVLSQIVTDGMTDIDKLWAIYKWTIGHIQYTGSSDKSDWMEGAMRGFKKGTGDCFNYYAVSRILMTRAGFDNKTITRIDGKTQHYWNLVYVGGGWFHFDTTPHYITKPFTGFLRTDDELANYSKEVKGYYKFDNSKYPATPSQPLDIRNKFFQ